MTTDLEKEREAFEAAHDFWDLSRRDDGSYLDLTVDNRWLSWLLCATSRAALAAPAAPQEQPSDAKQMVLDWMGENDVVLKDRAFKQLCALLSRYGASPQSGEDAQPVAWRSAQQVADLPAVHEALEAFSHDSTEDNAVGLVLAVLEVAPQPAPQGALIEQIAKQWDGCNYDDVGGVIDIGEAIRKAAGRLDAAPQTAPEPIWDIQPQLAAPKYGAEPSLRELIIDHYMRGGFSTRRAVAWCKKYMTALTTQGASQ